MVQQNSASWVALFNLLSPVLPAPLFGGTAFLDLAALAALAAFSVGTNSKSSFWAPDPPPEGKVSTSGKEF